MSESWWLSPVVRGRQPAGCRPRTTSLPSHLDLGSSSPDNSPKRTRTLPNPPPY